MCMILDEYSGFAVTNMSFRIFPNHTCDRKLLFLVVTHQVRFAQVFVPHGLISRCSSISASLVAERGARIPAADPRQFDSLRCADPRILYDLIAESSGRVVGKMGSALEEKKWQLQALNKKYHIDSWFLFFFLCS
ncbi:hypothetical protein EJB05_35081 [Eragrostis curvula]|uniref:Uncharacterized protein n=1 Tax=Eragrostis curvula TaxID=38414 RepID=A0A5J9U6T8_9POAL|nr:hypothetical protein EJB05_35081 [Eragrostis curvula]